MDADNGVHERRRDRRFFACAWRSSAAIALLAGSAFVGTFSTIEGSPIHAAEPAWQGWVTSSTNAGRRLAPISPVSDPATRGIVIDPANLRQTWQGVGASLTDASVEMLQGNSTALSLLFDPANPSGAHLNYLRLPLSATDLSRVWWTYGWNASTNTVTPPAQARQAIAVLQQIRVLRPDLRVVATPWTAPAAMKTPKSLSGGALTSGKETVYSRLLVAQVKWLQSQGVPLTALSIVNEPFIETDKTYPVTAMTTSQQVKIAKEAGPTLASLGVQLWAVDHNWSHAAQVATVLAQAPATFAAAAFHCYGGTPGQMLGTAVAPIVTECTQSMYDDPTISFEWDARNLVVDSIGAGSTGLFAWNLALDGSGGPRKAPSGGASREGCTQCVGLVSVVGGQTLPEQKFYTLAHLARSADPGARNLGVAYPGDIPAVGFRNPDGTVGVFGYNDSGSAQIVSIRVQGAGERRFRVEAGEVFTLRGLPGSPEQLTTGKILISPEGFRYYADTTGYRHFITSDGVFNCYGGWTNAIQNVPWSTLNSMPETEQAACFTAHVGDIIKHPDGDSYVLDQDASGLVRRWIPSVPDFVCARAEANRAVVTVTRYHIAEIRSGVDRAGGNCIVRAPGGDAHFVNNEGNREWIPDSPTWDCEVGRDIRVLNVPDGFVGSVPEVGWHYCLNRANLRGKLLRHTDGDAYYIHTDDTKTWIPDGATFACRTNQGTPVVDTRWREYVNAFPGSEWDYCYDINTLKGRIVTHPDGDSHYVDSNGIRHWIPTQSVFNCLRGRGMKRPGIRGGSSP